MKKYSRPRDVPSSVTIRFPKLTDDKIRQVIERVKYPEDIHAGFHSQLAELEDDVVRIVGISDRVGASQ